MPSAWDANANTNLLISINEIQNPKPPNWKDVAEKMKAKGYEGFTHEACRQHYQKLRKDAKKASGEDSAPSTPAKKANPGKSSGSGRKGGKKVTSPATGSAGDDDESIQSPPPSKKRKRAATLKQETADQNDEGVYGRSGPKFKVEESGASNINGEGAVDEEEDPYAF